MSYLKFRRGFDVGYGMNAGGIRDMIKRWDYEDGPTVGGKPVHIKRDGSFKPKKTYDPYKTQTKRMQKDLVEFGKVQRGKKPEWMKDL